MRKRTARLLAAVAAGLAVSVAVPGYAAGMLNDGAELSVGGGRDVACDADGVATHYSVASGADGFVVDAVEVDDVDAACSGGDLHIQLRSADGAVMAAGSASVASESVTVRLHPQPLAADVTGIDVVLAR